MKYKMNLSINIILGLILVFIAGCQKGNFEKLKPNIVVIFIDDMGYGDISCFGDQTINTPNIYALADNGIIFTNFRKKIKIELWLIISIRQSIH